MKPLEPIDKLNRLTESHGALRPGKGMIAGVIGVVDDYVPNGFFRRFMFPPTWKG